MRSRVTRAADVGTRERNSVGFTDSVLYKAISCNKSGEYGITGGGIVVTEDGPAVYVNNNAKKETDKTVLNLDRVSIMNVRGKNRSPSLLGIGDISTLVRTPNNSLNISGYRPVARAGQEASLNKINGVINRINWGVAVLVNNTYETVNLINSKINSFFVGLQAQGYGTISMLGGSIKGAYVDALAVGGGRISLNRVNIDALGVGLWSFGKSVIQMQSGQIIIENGGVGVIAEAGGLVVLDGTTIRVSEVNPKAFFSEYSAGFLSYGGNISFKNGQLEGSNTVALLINDAFPSNLFDYASLQTANPDNAAGQGAQAAPEEVVLMGGKAIVGTSNTKAALIEETSSVIEHFLGPDLFSAKSGGPSTITKFMISEIQQSTITMRGKSYGIYFDGEEDFIEDNKKKLEREKDKRNRLHAVLLKGTRLEVPNGVAIYGDNLAGNVVIKDTSNVSGGLLLNAESKSDLSVFVQNSSIIGGARIEKGSHAKLFLSNGSQWHVKKNLYSSVNSSDHTCVDSCISSIKLSDSDIKFLTSFRNGNAGDIEYRTLRIGSADASRNGVVYTASGTSKIHFNVNLASSGAKNTQVSDRLIVNGDVEGKTIVHVNDTSGGEGQADSARHSVSLIQVYGQAQQDSFRLDGSYVTLGTPYQYTLHAVQKIDDSFNPTLLGLGNKFWDFSLEIERVVSVGEGTEGSPLSERVVVQSPPSLSTGSGTNESSTDLGLTSTMVSQDTSNDLDSEDHISSTPYSETGDTLLLTTDENGEAISISLLDNSRAEYGDAGYSIVEEDDVESADASVGDLIPTFEASGNTPSTSGSVLTTGETIDESVDTSHTASPNRTGSQNEVGYPTVLRSDNDTVDVNDVDESGPTPSPRTEDRLTGGNSDTLGISLLDSSSAESDAVGYTIVDGEGHITEDNNTTVELVPSQAVMSSATPQSSTLESSVLGRSDTGDSDMELGSLTGTSPVSETEERTSSSAVQSSSLGTVKTEVPAASGKTKKPQFSSTLVNSTKSKKRKPTSKKMDSKPVARVLLYNKGSDTLRSESHKPMVATVSANAITQEGVSSQCSNTGENGTERLQGAYSCSDGKTYTMKNLTLKASEATQHSMHAKSQNTIIKLEGATISGADSSDSKNNVNSTVSKLVSAVLAEDKAEVILDKKSKIQSSVIGLEAQSGGKVTMKDGTVNALYVGALAGSGSSVNLKDTKINVTGDLAVAGLASKAGEVTMDSGAITLAKGVAVRSEAGGSVKLDKVDITVKKTAEKLDSADNFARAAFLVSDNASVDFKNGNVVTDAHALWVRAADGDIKKGSSRQRRSSDVRLSMNRANIESSIVRVEGDGSYGIYFDGTAQRPADGQNQVANGNSVRKTRSVERSAVSKQEKTPIGITGAISLKKTDFEVANGIAIYGNNSGGYVSLENKTTLAGDLLLKAENDSNISVSVDNSVITGGVRVDKSSYAKLDLANSSQWVLKRSAQRNLGTSDLGCVDSCISSVSLVNSAIDFAPSESEGKYQTLHIGNGKGTVYAAQGNAVIYLNARLNPRDPSDQQVTDRLVIHGDISGKTKIHVRGDAGNVGDGQANAKIAHSVSVIQVYGQAKKDSFQLDGNYVALSNSPYKYTLRAYAPEATSKQEHVQQKFVKDGGEFWNFRLENQYVKSMRSAALPEQFVRSVVPQVPTYLSLPNSVFHAGLMDISNQNKQLETLRMTSTGMVEVRENPALYLRGYGGSYRYSSDLSALEYGYDGDLSYNGVEAGVLLQTIENTDSAISFGVMGTYGKLSLQPLNVEHSQKSAFDKWTATVYGSMQHNVGFYVDGLLSYGLFKGDVLTLARGKTATLKGNPLSVSLSGGQTIATGYKGFVFDPQVQVVYQHLQFNKARDIDDFDIEMGNLDQWVVRVGGRLTKTPTGSEGVNAVAFYGKLYLAHGFEEKQSVHFKDAFKLGAFGSSLEAGLGFNAKLLPQFSLHADALYQHKLNKAGFSGISFSGGVRYQF